MILGLIGLLAGTPGRLQKKESSARMTFRVPPAARLFLSGMGLWLVLTPPLLMTKDITDGATLFLFLFYELMACALGGLCLWAAGIRGELSLDFDHRTYRYRYGWGLQNRMRSGGFEEFAGVFVRCVSGRETGTHIVGLAWKNGALRTPTLGVIRGSSSNRRKADALAAEMVNALRLPLVPAPPPETIRDLFRRVSHV